MSVLNLPQVYGEGKPCDYRRPNGNPLFCPYPAYRGLQQCVFHSDKAGVRRDSLRGGTHSKSYEILCRDFAAGFQEILRIAERVGKGYVNFEGFIFPETSFGEVVPSATENISDAVFVEDKDFAHGQIMATENFIKCSALPHDDTYQCPHPVEGTTSRCIFHIRKHPFSKILSEPDEIKNRRLNINSKFKVEFETYLRASSRSPHPTIDCRGFQFPHIQFPNEDVGKRFDFTDAMFVDDVTIQGTTDEKSLVLAKGGKFENAKFEGRVTFGNLLVETSLTFENVKFAARAEFKNLKIEDRLEFRWAKVSDVVLNQVECDKFSGFSTEFLGSAVFNGLISTKGSLWLSATFKKDVVFTNCISGRNEVKKIDSPTVEDSGIGSSAEVPPMTCKTDTEATEPPVAAVDGFYGESYVPDRADFGLTTFLGEVRFTSCNFYHEVNFLTASFAKGALFESYRDDMFHNEVSFMSVKLPDGEKLSFIRSNLSKASFLGTNIEDWVFSGVKWARDGRRWTWAGLVFGRPKCLWDDIRRPRTEATRQRISENYSQIVKNCESKRDYIGAEQFHIGEMENIRTASDWRIRWYFNSYFLYLISSRYGTSFIYAIVVLLLTLIGCTILFMFSGIKASATNATDAGVLVDYNLCWECSPTDIAKIATDFCRSLLYTLEAATFQKEKYYEPDGQATRFLLYPAIVLIAGQTALLLLAIRRIFKR